MNFLIYACLLWLLWFSIPDINERIDRKFRKMRKEVAQLEDTIRDLQTSQQQNMRRPKPAYAHLHRHVMRRRTTDTPNERRAS